MTQRSPALRITPHSRIGLPPSVRRRAFVEAGAADNSLREFGNAGAVN